MAEPEAGAEERPESHVLAERREKLERLRGEGVEPYPHQFEGRTEIATVYDVCHNIAKFEEYEINGVKRKLCVHRKGATRAFGPGEKELAERVLQASQCGKTRLVNVSLKGFYALAQSAKVYVGGDTGPTHIALAAGAPIVGMFGPTEWWRNGSPNPQDICVERTDINCRVDCHRRACSNWICMDIDVERVLRAVAMRIGANEGVSKSALPLAVK